LGGGEKTGKQANPSSSGKFPLTAACVVRVVGY